MERKPDAIVVTREIAERLNNFNIETIVYPGDELTSDEPIPGVNKGRPLLRTVRGYAVWSPLLTDLGEEEQRKEIGIDLSPFEEMYESFEPGHKRDHVIAVRNIALQLGEKYAPEQLRLIYVAATFHDIGLVDGRDGHEARGAEFVRKLPELRQRFTRMEIEDIAHAVGEHRASVGSPQTVLAKIISDADRACTTTSEAIRRAFEYGKHHYPHLSDEEQMERVGAHLTEKFSLGAYGRRTYFPETEAMLAETFDPIVEAYRNKDIDRLWEMMNNA